MEQYEDIKSELQQELQDLQQNVDQHSSFNREVWQRAVKRYSKHLYRQILFLAIFLVIIFAASTLLQIWPWWILIPCDLIIGFFVVEALIGSNGLRKADVQSREGLLSMRECMRKDSTYSKRRLNIMKIVALFGVLWGLVMLVYLYFYNRDIFVPVLVAVLAPSVFGGSRFNKRIKKESDDFVEEIDELLKE
jgi:fatty acid desaturase